MRGGVYNPACNFALPSLPTPSPAFPHSIHRRNEVKRTGSFKPVVTSPKPQDYVSMSAVPSDFTWCNVSGVNHCTTDLNQHIPQCVPVSGMMHACERWHPPVSSSCNILPQILRQLLGPRLNVGPG